MFRFVAWGGAAVVCVTLLCGWGCSGAPSRIEAPSINAAAAGQEAMKQYDANGDGKIAGAELDKSPALKAALQQIDASGDKSITAEEITARVQKWQESKVGRMITSCRVARKKGNGDEPLEGVKVTLEPEKFLGDKMPTCTGVTDKRGVAQLTELNADPPGVPPGLYLVRLEKAGLNIPAKYNTQTTLGMEVAQDTGNYGPATFILDF